MQEIRFHSKNQTKSVNISSLYEMARQYRGNLEIKNILNHLYWNKELSLQEVGKSLNISGGFVRKLMIINNVERREQYSAHAYKYDKLREIDFTDEQKQIIYGSLLGDGNIHKHGKGYRYHEGHSINQINYCDFKKNKLKQFIIKSKKTEVNTIIHPFLKKIYNRIYINGVKKITNDFLMYLNDKAIAIWFMDDGAKAGSSVCLCTYSFTKKENELLSKWFLETYNIKTTIRLRKNKYYELYIKKESLKKFYNLIKNYIIPSMKYKFPSTVETNTPGVVNNNNEDIVRSIWRHVEISRNDLSPSEDGVTKKC